MILFDASQPYYLHDNRVVEHAHIWLYTHSYVNYFGKFHLRSDHIRCLAASCYLHDNRVVEHAHAAKVVSRDHIVGGAG